MLREDFFVIHEVKTSIRKKSINKIKSDLIAFIPVSGTETAQKCSGHFYFLVLPYSRP